MAAGVLGSLVPDLYLWLALRFVAGAMSLGYNNVLSVYKTELTGGKWRSRAGHYFGESFWNVGLIVLGTLAYFIRNMRTLELVVGLSASPFILGWLLMPESPRWQLVKGRKKEAKRTMRMICRVNRRSTRGLDEFVDNFRDHARQDREEEERGGFLLPMKTVWDLFRYPATRRNTILMSYCWLSFSMGYFGLIYNTPAFDWSPFLVFMFPAFLILPLCVVEPYFENRFGRKPMLSFTLIGAGLALFVTLLFPRGSLGIVVFAWAGTVSCSVAFGAGYTYTKDLFPTTHRTSALGTASASARIGSIISPFIALSR